MTSIIFQLCPRFALILSFLAYACQSYAQVPAQTPAPPATDARLYTIAQSPSASRLEADIRKLASFGTRSTLSDTVSQTRGIGAARRWIKAEFDKISTACNGCLEVSYQRTLVPAEGNRRIAEDTWVVNVIAIQRGTQHPNRYAIMSGDIDSRASDVMDGEIDAPGAMTTPRVWQAQSKPQGYLANINSAAASSMLGCLEKNKACLVVSIWQPWRRSRTGISSVCSTMI